MKYMCSGDTGGILFMFSKAVHLLVSSANQRLCIVVCSSTRQGARNIMNELWPDAPTWRSALCNLKGKIWTNYSVSHSLICHLASEVVAGFFLQHTVELKSHIPVMAKCLLFLTFQHAVKHVVSFGLRLHGGLQDNGKSHSMQPCVSDRPVMAGMDLELGLANSTFPSFGSDKLVSLWNSCFLDSWRETEVTQNCNKRPFTPVCVSPVISPLLSHNFLICPPSLCSPACSLACSSSLSPLWWRSCCSSSSSFYSSSVWPLRHPRSPPSPRTYRCSRCRWSAAGSGMLGTQGRSPWEETERVPVVKLSI